MKTPNQPIVKDLLLIGGGHSHLFVLKYFAMQPQDGLRITLITRDLHTPYSGMLPGYISGHYSYDETHIDLRPLALSAGARVIHATVSSIDFADNRVHCDGRPPIAFDVVSINTGSTPGLDRVEGAASFAIPVKPIDRFLQRWQLLEQQAITHIAAAKPYTLSVVGGGAGGVEMALSMQFRIQHQLQQQGLSKKLLQVNLFSNSQQILPSHNRMVQQTFTRILAQRNIRLFCSKSVVTISDSSVTTADGEVFATDGVLFVTNASAPKWLAESGLDVDEKGFVAVHDTLQSISHPQVFAAGDIAAVVNHPRPKSGVFAVRQGMPLAKNLARAVTGKALTPYKPQKNFLGLISSGDKYAVASRGSWSLQGKWLWRVKDWIDRRFMQSFAELPAMQQGDSGVSRQLAAIANQDAISEISAMAMRCGGCGAKIGSTVLSRVINRLEPIRRDDIVIGLQDPDDAAVAQVPAGKLIVQSVDYFRSFIDDPYLFGKIAANHALSDLFAMGADTQSAMAIATVPYGIEAQVEELLYQMMAGALVVLNESNTALVGGHSSEGSELAFGLSVTGLVDRQQIMRKRGMQPGDKLIVTKPLGTGTLFAADMRHKAKGRWIDAAIESMILSNQQAGLCLHRYGVTSCTDVTGFGLLGHLVEMTKASATSVEIELSSLPIMDGALQMIEQGIFSSLQAQNVRLRRALQNAEKFTSHAHYPMLFDPQTSGGLLAAVPAVKVDLCLAELKKLGYCQSVVIGQVIDSTDIVENVRLV